MSISMRNPVASISMLHTVWRSLRLTVRLLGDARVRLWPKLIVVAALIYLISPMDLMPDLLVPVLGHTDDLLVLWLASRALVRFSPPEVVAEYEQADPRR